MTRVGIFGAAGYGGVDLIRMLVNHPEAEVTYLAGHTTVGQALSEMYPFLLGACDLPIEETSLDLAAEKADVLCFALPHATATEMIKQALTMGKQVIDFSADFRLKDPASTPPTTRSIRARSCSRRLSTASRSCTGRRSSRPTSSPCRGAIPPARSSPSPPR